MPAIAGQSEASLHARIAAYSKWAKVADRHEAMRPLWEGRWRRYLEQVDPDGTLPEEERVKRAEAARKADLYRMSLASVRARRLRREAKAKETARRLAQLERGGGDAA